MVWIDISCVDTHSYRKQKQGRWKGEKLLPLINSCFNPGVIQEGARRLKWTGSEGSGHQEINIVKTLCFSCNAIKMSKT